LNLLQAALYFLREAAIGLLRSWRVSLLAVFTIGVSLFLAGGFLLASRNLAGEIHTWREEARFVVYLAESSTDVERTTVEKTLRDAPWTLDVAYVSPEEGAARFRTAFPSLAELVDDARYGSLPASFEARQRPVEASEAGAHRRWTQQLSSLPGVETLDDDRDWISEVETLLLVARAIGSVLTTVLLGAAVFTIASVVRLTSFLYRDEIAVMRLVGATEFFIRGPFLVEGTLQGLAGALLALLSLRLVHWTLASQLDSSLVLSLVARSFLSLGEMGQLLLLGAAAGLGGALVSMSRERPASQRA